MIGARKALLTGILSIGFAALSFALGVRWLAAAIFCTSLPLLIKYFMSDSRPQGDLVNSTQTLHFLIVRWNSHVLICKHPEWGWCLPIATKDEPTESMCLSDFGLSVPLKTRESRGEVSIVSIGQQLFFGIKCIVHVATIAPRLAWSLPTKPSVERYWLHESVLRNELDESNIHPIARFLFGNVEHALEKLELPIGMSSGQTDLLEVITSRQLNRPANSRPVVAERVC
ncbi:MAG: hypothetical protein ABL962_19820 [Fimbriimonadaceae bacterium]